MIDVRDQADQYDIVISKLKAMQYQRFSINEIVEAYKESKNDVINYLESRIIVSILSSNEIETAVISKKINYINDLENTIRIGLLEAHQ